MRNISGTLVLTAISRTGASVDVMFPPGVRKPDGFTWSNSDSYQEIFDQAPGCLVRVDGVWSAAEAYAKK